jgi:hypothetical protein
MPEKDAEFSPSWRRDNSKTHYCPLAKGDIEVFRLGCNSVGVSCPYYLENKDGKGYHCKQMLITDDIGENHAGCAYGMIILFEAYTRTSDMEC